MRFCFCLLAPGLVAGVMLLAISPVWAGVKEAEAAKDSGKGLKIKAELTADDPMDTIRKGSHAKTYEYKMEAGKAYQIDMVSLVDNPNKFDPYLRLEDASGKRLAEDDDGGGFPNARITFMPRKTGTYKIIATTFQPGMTGKYVLTVAPATAAAAAYGELQQQLQAQLKGLDKEFLAAPTVEEKKKVQARLPEVFGPHAERLVAFLDMYGADPVARRAEQELKQITAQFLVRSDMPAASKALSNMLAAAKQKQLKGEFSLALAENLRARYEKAYQKKNKAEAAKLADEADGLLTGVSRDYALVKAPGSLATLGKQADDALFVLRNLSVGKTAPNIEGEDTGGKKLKLSDYRGKVVVVDFWATWCGPCRAMIPHEKDLVKRLKDQPFVFLGVNADGERQTAQKFIEKEEMRWRNFFDGEHGPITTAYRIQYFPTIYVLDTSGVIRYRDVRGPDMDQAVEELLKEAKGAKK
jgi:thiol-disulfide isomerase/thioredoxin